MKMFYYHDEHEGGDCIAVVEDGFTEAKNKYESGPGNCKDRVHIRLKNVICLRQDDTEVDYDRHPEASNIKLFRAIDRKAIKAMLLATKQPNCVLGVSTLANRYMGFHWLKVTSDTSAWIRDGETYNQSFYDSAFTCMPTRREMRIYYDIEKAVDAVIALGARIAGKIEEAKVLAKAREEAKKGILNATNY